MQIDSSTPCPSCDQKVTLRVGRLKGRSGIIRLPDPGNLFRCKKCGLFFRHPYPPPSELKTQYRDLPSSLWQGDKRPDFQLAAQAISSVLPSGRVLDVGCFRGDFLKLLPKRYQGFGIEPSLSAREIAQASGITLVAESIETINSDTPRFEAITLLDVIEHLPHPFISLQILRRFLLPNGLLVISTGDTNSLPWRMMRLEYWYYFPDHVSFFNRRWFAWAARRLDLEVESMKRFSHFRSGPMDRWRQLLRCISFGLMKSTEGHHMLRKALSLLYPLSRASRWVSPPTAELWKDHLLVVLKAEA